MNISLSDLRAHREQLQERLRQVDEAIAALESLGGLQLPPSGSKRRVSRTKFERTGSKKKPAKSREALLLSIIAHKGGSIPVKEVLAAMRSAGYEFKTDAPKLNWLYTPRGKKHFLVKHAMVRAKE